jgi:hypothetical protein
MRQERMTALPPFDLSGVISGAEQEPVLTTHHGALFNEDCIAFMAWVEDESVDTVFADPPFNLGKVYGPRVDDEMSEADYASAASARRSRWPTIWSWPRSRATAPTRDSAIATT